uniref:Uncharacterized protein n=1 Tax=Acrobeloides nanus TaxID=290746 RepID=A0A914CWC9_9BILA
MKCFGSAGIILFMNKKDLFMEKITNFSLSNLFPDYTGGLDYANGIAYLREKFGRLYKNTTVVALKIIANVAMNPAADSSVPDRSGAIQSDAVNAPATIPPINKPNIIKIINANVGVVQSTNKPRLIKQTAAPAHPMHSINFVEAVMPIRPEFRR